MKRSQKTKTKSVKAQQKLAAENQTSKAVAKDTLDQFEFLKVMGKGAFGKVFKARDKLSQELVAVKQILENENMMNRETQILDMIGQHPNTISLKSHFYT